MAKRSLCEAEAAGPSKKAKVSVLQLLQRPMSNADADHAQNEEAIPSVDLRNAVQAPERYVEPSSTEAYVRKLTKAIDCGIIKLLGNPWVLPTSQAQAWEENEEEQCQDGNRVLNPARVAQLVTRPAVFVWSPEHLFPDWKIVCPSCSEEPREARWWHNIRTLHGLTFSSAYVTRQYTCTSCAALSDAKRPRGRRRRFAADAPAFLTSLPDHIRMRWQMHDTGRALYETSVMDFIRALATRTSWAAIADSLNEMRQTTWARNVRLQYYQICAKSGLHAEDGAPDAPVAQHVTAKLVRSLYMADARSREEEVQEELCSEAGDQVLVFDWTRDAAARCSSCWLFNVMDGQGLILCSTTTRNCSPAEVKPFLQQLATRGAEPKVIYVDEECCGAWPGIVTSIWPDALVKLDGLHALRRLTGTTTSTQHPWHGRFCNALSKAIYTEDHQVTERVREARVTAGLEKQLPPRTRSMCVPRIITDSSRIIRAVEDVLKAFQPPDGKMGSLLTEETLAAWQRLKNHVAKGCLCDPPGVELSVFTHEQIVDGVRLPIVRTRRGASALEGFHTHQKSWLGSLGRHTPEAGAALLADGALRWNRRVRGKRSPEQRQPMVFAGGLLKQIQEAQSQVKEIAASSSACTS